MSGSLTRECFEANGVTVGDASPVVSEDGLVAHQPICSKAEILRQGAEAMSRLTGGHTWDDWVKVMWALDIARSTAMLEAGTNQPSGRKYSEAFGKWLRCHSEFEPIGKLDKADRCRLFECLQNLDAINAWRATLPPHRLLKLNYPPAVLRKWKRSLESPSGNDSPVAETESADSTTVITLKMVLTWLAQASAEDRERVAEAVVPGMAGDKLTKLMSPAAANAIRERILHVGSKSASARPQSMARALGQLLSHVKVGNHDGARTAADGFRRLVAAGGCDPDNIREVKIKAAAKRAA